MSFISDEFYPFFIEHEKGTSYMTNIEVTEEEAKWIRESLSELEKVTEFIIERRER